MARTDVRETQCESCVMGAWECGCGTINGSAFGTCRGCGFKSFDGDYDMTNKEQFFAAESKSGWIVYAPLFFGGVVVDDTPSLCFVELSSGVRVTYDLLEDGEGIMFLPPVPDGVVVYRNDDGSISYTWPDGSVHETRKPIRYPMGYSAQRVREAALGFGH